MMDCSACVDYQVINKINIKNKFPMPQIHDLMHKIKGKIYFSKIDLRSGYYQIPIQVDQGCCKFCVMPFGLCNIPLTIQAVMNFIFIKILWKYIIIFFYDILIYNVEWDAYTNHLNKALGILEKHCVYVKESTFTCGK